MFPTDDVPAKPVKSSTGNMEIALRGLPASLHTGRRYPVVIRMKNLSDKPIDLGATPTDLGLLFKPVGEGVRFHVETDCDSCEVDNEVLPAWAQHDEPLELEVVQGTAAGDYEMSVAFGSVKSEPVSYEVVGP